MARPKKKTVTYFPHQVDHGKTIFILEERFGNDGYAFWFKLLEILGKTEGHVFRCGNPEEWMFLVAKTHVSDETATKILDTLAALNAIDQELWQEKTIWIQNFIDGIAEVYKKRKVETPARPGFRGQKPQTTDVSGSENPQSKVKKRREEKSKEEERKEEKNISRKIYTGKPAETAISESINRHIYHLIEQAFVSKNLDKDFNFKREGPHIKQLEEKALARASPDEFIKKAIVVFWQLTRPGSNDKLFKKQPFLPSILNSGGLWPRVLTELENREEQLDPEMLESARRIFNYDNK